MILYGGFLENEKPNIEGGKWLLLQGKMEAKIRSHAEDLSGNFQIRISCLILLFYTLNDVVLV